MRARDAGSVTPPFVSVIIPVFGDVAPLMRCLDHVAHQTYSRARFEVIVADNGCPDLTRATRGRDVRVVREPHPGSYAARNAGLAIAAGEIIAFTDADCLPSADWIARAVEALAAPAATGIVAGRIALVRPRPPGVSALAYAYSACYSFNRHGAGGLGATANLIVRRAVMDTVGPFDTTLLSGGDMDWGKRAELAGIATRYAHEVSVVHAARPTVRSILRRELRLAGGTQINHQRAWPASAPRMIRTILNIELRGHVPWAVRELASAQHEWSPVRRAQVGALMLVAQTLRASERIRVFSGGRPRRA